MTRSIFNYIQHVTAISRAPFNSRPRILVAARLQRSNLLTRADSTIRNRLHWHTQPSALHQSHVRHQAHFASPLSSHRTTTKSSAMSPSPSTPKYSDSAPPSEPSSSRSYTGIRLLLSANDINTDGYPDSTWRPRRTSSVEELFVEAGSGGGAHARGGDPAPDG